MGLTAMFVKICEQNSSVVDYRVMGGVKQCQVAFRMQGTHMRNSIGVCIKLLRMSVLKFLPECLFMAKPFA